MTEASTSPESFYAPIPPAHTVAVFEEGRYKIYERPWRDKVEFVHVDNKDHRDYWVLLNMGVFNNGTFPSPERAWRSVIEYWLTDIKDAARLGKLDREQSKEVKETELDIKATMAVSASARAMEVSDGSAAKYATVLTQSTERPDLDKQDEWKEYLLHDDEKKLARVLNIPMVRHFYIRLLEDAGFEVPQGWKEGQWVKGKLVYNNVLTYKDIKRATNFKEIEAKRNELREGKSKLFLYLQKGRKREKREPREYMGGFNRYIDYLIDGPERGFVDQLANPTSPDSEKPKAIDRIAVWAAAKLACDAFLVDKYTLWEYALQTPKERSGQENAPRLLPYEGWGGDPLRSIIQPSFLPRVIKGTWGGIGTIIMNMTDWAWRPDDAFRTFQESGSVQMIPVSMVGNLKDFARWSEALWLFYGETSIASGISTWTRKVVEEEYAPEKKGDLERMAGLLFQVYGNKKAKALTNGPKGQKTVVRSKTGRVALPSDAGLVEGDPAGRHVGGFMMSAILTTKALAAALESQKPGLKEHLADMFDPEGRGRPFLEIMQAIWGVNLDAKSGLISRWAGPQFGYIFSGNVVKTKNGASVEQILRESWRMLRSNNQDEKARAQESIYNMVGFMLDLAGAIGGTRKR